MTSTYLLRLEQDETGMWTVSVPAILGCLSQGISLVQATTRIREALSLFVSDSATSKLTMWEILPFKHEFPHKPYEVCNQCCPYPCCNSDMCRKCGYALCRCKA